MVVSRRAFQAHTILFRRKNWLDGEDTAYCLMIGVFLGEFMEIASHLFSIAHTREELGKDIFDLQRSCLPLFKRGRRELATVGHWHCFQTNITESFSSRI